MRIFFIGTVEFSKRALQKIVDVGGQVIGVATKESSRFNADYADLSDICSENEIPYRYVGNINSADTIDWIESLKPDVIFCFGWSSLIKKHLLDLPSMGIVGYHPAKLPKNRGRHPIIWALRLGLEETGSTFFFMDEGADSGDILSQETVAISFEDDARSLYDKISQAALCQIEQFVPQLQSGRYRKEKQDNRLANYWRKRNAKDGEINFSLCSTSIYNLVRSLTVPYVGAHVVYENSEVKVWKVKICRETYANNIEPGKILDIQGISIIVKTEDGAIELLDHEFIDLPQIGTYL